MSILLIPHKTEISGFISREGRYAKEIEEKIIAFVMSVIGAVS